MQNPCNTNSDCQTGMYCQSVGLDGSKFCAPMPRNCCLTNADCGLWGENAECLTQGGGSFAQQCTFGNLYSCGLPAEPGSFHPPSEAGYPSNGAAHPSNCR